jgi:predicted ATPase
VGNGFTLVLLWNFVSPQGEVDVGFLHDKVQQSLIALIPEGERSGFHYQIGRELVRRMTLEDQIESYVLEICNQLNQAQDRLDTTELEELIELNIRAGRKALKSSAIASAKAYFQTAKDLLGENPWHHRRRLTLDVVLANNEALMAAKDIDEAIDAIDEALKYTQSPQESISFLLQKVDCKDEVGQWIAAFNAGLTYVFEVCG